MAFDDLTVQDILCFNRSKKLDPYAVLPFIVLPVLIIIGSISRNITIAVMVIISMGALYVYSRPRQKHRSPFFHSWTLSSSVFMFLVFEHGVLSYDEITQLENLIFLFFLGGTCFFFYKMRAVANYELSSDSFKGNEYSPVLTSDSHYCHICQIEVNERFFHSIWWDCCIFRPNYAYYIAGLIFALAALAYGTNLGLSTVCEPYIFYGTILMPENCDDVYYDFETAICFVTCIYGTGYVIVTAMVLLHQAIVYIPRYCAPQWRRLTKVFKV